METGTLQAFLRVLYTVNSNPQYILAKSSSQVPVLTCSEATARSATKEPAYARAPLKACLEVVCDSSPELLQDSARDFSLYVLDPLESQPPPANLAHEPHSTSPPRGVAVALGLMSWALESTGLTNVFVTGTIVPNASLALEVVFALRETKRMSKPLPHTYPSFGPMHVSGQSQLLSQSRHAGMSRFSNHLQHDQQEQRTLTRSADFPEVYIGPPRRGRGRPEGSTSSKPKVPPQPSTSSLHGANLSNQSDGINGKPKPKSKARPPRPPTHSPFVCAPLTRHTDSGEPESRTKIYSQAQPYVFSTLLSGSSSTTTPADNPNVNTIHEQQAALLSALQGLLAANPHLLHIAATNAGLSTSAEAQETETKPICHGKNTDEHDNGDSDIEILDSSTIDTTAFRKTGQQLAADGKCTPVFPTNYGFAMPHNQHPQSSPLPASTPPSGQENTSVSSQMSTPSIVPKSSLTPEPETPTSTRVLLGQVEKDDLSTLDVPETPTPCRTRKRKFTEYIQSQTRPSISTSLSSSSPSMAHACSSERFLSTNQPIQSSTGGTKSVSSPLARLPSMLGSMLVKTISGSRPPVSSLSSLTHEHPVSSSTNKNGIQLIMVPSSSKADRTGINASSSGIAMDKSSLKRRRTLNEFMAEHEARRIAKIQKRSSSLRKSEVQMFTTASRANSLRSNKLASTSSHFHRSPPRSFSRSDLTPSSPPSTCQPGLVSVRTVSNDIMPFTTALACTAPSTSTSTEGPTKNPLTNFVLPMWARTSTAMLPRLSEGALARQRAEQEAKKARDSLKRREAAKSKRERVRGGERRSRECSDNDEEAGVNDAKLRSLHPSYAARSTLLLPPPPPSLPVFASDAVEPIPSSPQSHNQVTLPVAPSTPPRKSVSSGAVPQRTPSKSCSLFTPSGHDPGSLFTPSTPSVTPSFTRVAFTPRSPTVLHRSATAKSPRKGVPLTPKSGSGKRETRTRAFLLPPPSPCASRSLHSQKQVHAKVPGGLIPITPEDTGIIDEESLPDKQRDKWDKGRRKTDILNKGDVLPGEDTAITPEQRPSCPTGQNDHGMSEHFNIIASNTDQPQEEEDYASSPLPPSSPLPGSSFSSPAKNPDTPRTNILIVPDSDNLLPTSSDCDGSGIDTPCLSDGPFTEASAWLTETEAWLTDTEGGPLPTDSDGAWLSDSDGIFADMSSLPRNSASNWFIDGTDVKTDGEARVTVGEGGGFDAAAFERAFAVLVERGRRDIISQDEGGENVATQSASAVEPGLWESLQPLFGVDASRDAGSARDGVDESVDEKAARDLQELLDVLPGDT